VLQKVYRPREHHKLASLRHIYSTGSPLPPALFDYVYEHIKERVLLASITGNDPLSSAWSRSEYGAPGGTDICSLFAGVCSALPVFRGEIQCRLLGMAVTTFAPDGTPSRKGEPGELVCLKVGRELLMTLRPFYSCPAPDFMTQAFPMSTRGVLAFTWLL
jgi:acetoacetyl-CoA synthetase